MTDEELKAYAEHLIQQGAEDVSWLTINEVYDEYIDSTGNGGRGFNEIADDDARKVSDLISSAKVTVTW